jgi:cytochrome c
MTQAAPAAVLAALALLGGCDRPTQVSAAVDAERGRRLIADYHCGACHTIPGVRAADGVVAPPLTAFARRSFIAGEVPNTRDNLVAWIQDPRLIEPGTAMPVLGLTQAEARDVAAYLGGLE